MSTRLEEKEEKILKIFEKLAEESSKGIPIIVEGEKDTRALRILEIKGEIIEAKTAGKSILNVLSEVQRSTQTEVILLLDFDRRGKQLSKRLRRHLDAMRIRSNVFFWERLQAIVGRELKDIEGLASYMETLKSKIGQSA